MWSGNYCELSLILTYKRQEKCIVSSLALNCVNLFLHVCWCVLVRAWQDLLHGRIQMKTLTNKWYEEVRQGPSGSEDEEDEAELL